MALHDVWRSYSKDANVYHKYTFADVPTSPGIYAWFYPLRLSGDKLASFITEINTVMSFDSSRDGISTGTAEIEFAWRRVGIVTTLTAKPVELTANVEDEWNEIRSHREARTSFEKMLLRSSVLMQPLYVGKTKNLQRRCTQHRNGDGDEKTFRSRFEMFSRVNKLRARSVDDLLYLTIDTRMDKVDDCFDVNLEDVLEEVMKRVCQPPYSKR